MPPPGVTRDGCVGFLPDTSGGRPLPPLEREVPALFDGPHMRGDVGLAVSGGGDSMAMLHMIGPALRAAGRRVAVATVDHGLRPEAAEEAAMVARACAGLDLPHDTLRWDGRDGKGNLAAAARDARYRLLADWARDRDLAFVALAHTRDDQAETFVMRLARGSGIDGLAAMQADGTRFGMRWVRPLLDISRADLRGWLKARGLDWAEDPSNADTASERVRVRQALEVLAGLGVTSEIISETVSRLGMARDALRDMARDAARMAEERAGALILPRRAFMLLPVETRFRLLTLCLRWISGALYGPRHAALIAAHAALVAGRGASLHGALLIGTKDRLVLARELRPVAALETATDAVWDGWTLDGPHDPGLTIRALGDGIRACNWRDTGLPRAALPATPAIWRGAELVAAPLAGKAEGWTARRSPDFAQFLKSD